MRKASELNLVGHLFYISSNSIEIYLSGSENKIDTFFRWANAMSETTAGKKTPIKLNINQLSGFKIINTL